MTGEDLLREAATVVRNRRRFYGEPAEFFERVAVRWSQVLRAEVTPVQVCLCLIDLKLARLAHDPAHLDSLVDVVGYAACMAEAGR